MKDLFGNEITEEEAGQKPILRHHLSKKQGIITHYLRTQSDTIDLDKAVKLVGFGIYGNTRKHVGQFMGNMVKRKMIRRLKPGIYVLNRS